MPLKYDSSEIHKKWNNLDRSKLNKDILMKFVLENFDPVGSDTKIFSSFPDFKENPAILEKITDAEFKKWAFELNQLWPILGRKTKKCVALVFPFPKVSFFNISFFKESTATYNFISKKSLFSSWRKIS